MEIDSLFLIKVSRFREKGLFPRKLDSTRFYKKSKGYEHPYPILLICAWFRRRRMHRFSLAFHPENTNLILDVRGTIFEINSVTQKSCFVEPWSARKKKPFFEYLVADGCDLMLKDHIVT